MIGDDIRARVFRDTKQLYIDYPAHIVAPPLIRFARTYAVPRILNLGCATGNSCLHLKEHGYTVSRADVSWP